MNIDMQNCCLGASYPSFVDYQVTKIGAFMILDEGCRTIPLMNDNRGVFGVNMGHLWHEVPKISRWMEILLQGVSEGWVRPHVDKAFSFAQAGEAHAYIEARKNIGKVVLTP